MHACMYAKSLQLYPTLFDPMDYSQPDSSLHGILQAGILEWAAMPPSRGFSRPRDRTYVSCIADGFFTTEPLGKPNIQICMYAKLYRYFYLNNTFIYAIWYQVDIDVSDFESIKSKFIWLLNTVWFLREKNNFKTRC